MGIIILWLIIAMVIIKIGYGKWFSVKIKVFFWIEGNPIHKKREINMA